MKLLVKRLLHRAMDGYVQARLLDIDTQRNMIAAAATARFIERNAPSAVSLHDRNEVLRYAAGLVRNQQGLVCEFGVFRGASINVLAECLPDRPVYGFDSFEGLPSVWRTGFQRGSFNLEGGLPDVRKNVQLVKGWFSDTLPEFLAQHQGDVALVHIDCDLYGSAKTVLDTIGARIRRGSVLVFDEYFNYPGWQKHEHKAFREFARSGSRKYDYVAYNAAHQQMVVKCTRSSQ